MHTSPVDYWQINHHAELAWRQWQDEFVCHHLLSNDTHRLSRLAGLILNELASSHRRSRTELAERLNLDPENVGAALNDLLALELVECCQ